MPIGILSKLIGAGSILFKKREVNSGSVRPSQPANHIIYVGSSSNRGRLTQPPIATIIDLSSQSIYI